MPSSRTSYTGNGSLAGPYTAPPYLEKGHVVATVAGVAAPFTWTNDTQITFTSVPGNTLAIVIQRTTPDGTSSFVNGAALNQEALNTVRLAAQYQIEELEDNVITDEDALSTIGTRTTTLEGEMNVAQADINVLEGSKISLEFRATALESEMTAVEGQATTLNSEMTAVEGRATTLESEMNAVEAQATALDSEMTAVEGRATTLEGQATTLDGEMTAVEGRATSLESSVGTLQTDVAALGGVDVSALQTDLDTAEASIVTINGEITAVEGRATTLEAEMNAVEGRATTLEGRATTLEGQATTLDSEMTAVEVRATSLESSMTAVQADVAVNAGNAQASLVSSSYAVPQINIINNKQIWAPMSSATGTVTAGDTEIVCLLTDSAALGYKIALEDVQLSLDNTQIHMEFSTDFGVSYIQAAGAYHWANAISNRSNPSTGSSSPQAGETSMKIQGNSNKGLDDDHPTRRLTFEVFLGDGVNFRNALKWEGGIQLFDSNSTNTLTTVLSGYGEMFTPTTRVTGLRFTLSQGSWTRATYKGFSRVV